MSELRKDATHGNPVHTAESETPRTDAVWAEAGNNSTNIIGKLLAKSKELERELAAKQAEIDRLMFEFCPDEMTEQQLTNWAAHIKPVSDDGSRPPSTPPSQETSRDRRRFILRLPNVFQHRAGFLEQ
jgi:hypothetical protein